MCIGPVWCCSQAWWDGRKPVGWGHCAVAMEGESDKLAVLERQGWV